MEKLKKKTRVAAYGLVVKDKRILLCRLSQAVTDKAGYWTLPGGGIDFGESPEEAVEREIKEETGLSIKTKELRAVDSIVLTSQGVSHHGIRIIYRVGNFTGDLKFEENGTTDRCEWFTYEEAFSLPLVSLAENGIELVLEPTA